MSYFLILSLIYATLMLSVNSEIWLQPTALSFQKSLNGCVSSADHLLIEELHDLQRPELSDNSVVHAFFKCLIHDLGLWSDVEGLQAKRIAKLLAKHKMTTEIILVIDFCNARHRNLKDTNRWAFEAYRCATSGRIGDWMTDYVKSLYAQKFSKIPRKSTFVSLL